jgi:formylglycine-generating enzyme required for sulfatase activity
MNRAAARNGLSMIALIAIAACFGCAEGKDPPTPTAMAEVKDGLTFQFGMGQQGCLVPSEEQCTSSGGAALRLGTPALDVVIAPFAIDVHEVTIEQYLFCVEMGVCSVPEGDETSNIREYWSKLAPGGGTIPNPDYFNYPVVYINWLQANEYCEFVDKRLPTEFEWERVAGGPSKSSLDKRIYPFGPIGPRTGLGKCTDQALNIYHCTKLDRPAEVKSHSVDVVTEGGTDIFDLFGNVYEWTASDGNENVTCDASQPYDCEACVSCLSGGKPAANCKPQCFGCTCGDGKTETKPNCYLPCETPICAVVPPEKRPVKMAPPTTWQETTRVIRGGSFFLGSGGPDIGPCEGRADERGFTRSQTSAHIALGFRCARSL